MKSKWPMVVFALCGVLVLVALASPQTLFRAVKPLPHAAIATAESPAPAKPSAETPSTGSTAPEKSAAKNPAAEQSEAELSVAENATTESPAIDPPLLTEAPGPTPPGMVWIPGGQFLMGSAIPDSDGNPDKLKQDEFPQHPVIVDGFWMDETAVTNAQFREFVDATGYVTSAEIPPKREDFLGIVPDVSLIPEENLVAGALVFNSDFDRDTFRTDFQGWELQAWKYQPGANWKHPTGPDSSLDGLDSHPVVNVTYADCVAYCQWAGKRLPTEAEWEYACRGGEQGRKYPWGDELLPDGQYLCNFWQGSFPLERKNDDGFLETAPVKAYPPNGYGLYEMSGNVWEWVNDFYRQDYYRYSPRRNPTGPVASFDPHEPLTEKRVSRGGSFLCNLNNCTGYRCAARMRSDVSSASFHTGFRCVISPRLPKLPTASVPPRK